MHPNSQKSVNEVMGWKLDVARTAGEGEVRDACAKPIGALTPGELCLLLIHQAAPHLIVPRALSLLEISPLTSAGNYPGELLLALLRLPQSYWEDHPEDWMRTHGVLHSIDEALSLIEGPRAAFLSVIGAKNSG